MYILLRLTKNIFRKSKLYEVIIWAESSSEKLRTFSEKLNLRSSNVVCMYISTE